MVTGYILGREIFYKNESWYYEDITEKVDYNNLRSCVRCGKVPGKNGHDSCINELPGVKYACCGHGINEGCIIFNDGRKLTGNFKIENNE